MNCKVCGRHSSLLRIGCHLIIRDARRPLHRFNGLTGHSVMLENMRVRWQEARAARLKEEFLDAFRRVNSFTEENAEHFGRTLDYAFRHWIANHGSVRESALEFRRSAVRELKSQASSATPATSVLLMDWPYFPFMLRRHSWPVVTPALCTI